MSGDDRVPKNCYATRPVGGSVFYCELAAFHDGDHKDQHGYWAVGGTRLTPRQEAALMHEGNKRVRSYKGDPRRDPALVKDVSVFIVAPPSQRTKA